MEFERLLAWIPVAAYICDADGFITYFNVRAVELWGREPKLNDTADRFCGALKLFSADGLPLPPHECWMALALRHRKTCDGLEILIERPDGSRSPALAYATPCLDENGELLGAVGLLADISSRRQAELSHAHLAAIVDSSDDAIISKSLDGILLSWNAAAQRLFGYSAQEAVGRHISFLIPAERADEEEQILARLRAGERIEHFDTVRLRKDGHRIPVFLTISPIRDDTGRIVGASKIARDISDSKRAEKQIYRLLTRLKEADRCKDEFLATLAHELRSPLAPLRSLLEILKRGDGGADLLEQVREIMERQLGQIVRLVDDLLDVSRIGSNKLELRRERIELAPVIHQAVEACRPLAQGSRHRLAVNLPAKAIFLHADPVRLVQVFSNLLDNACKYTDEGGSIQLTAEPGDRHIVVRVKDSGIGIPGNKLAQVFEMFAQAQPASERSRGGLGIGLTVVKRLVEMHGGTVSATSPGPGQGSEFIVRLPLLSEAPQDFLTQTPIPSDRAVSGRRILVVDDDPDSAESLALLLKMSGNETATAHDGLTAMASAEIFRPDVVLLDLGLPKLDGHEVARRIRQQPWGKDMVLVALTGWGEEEDRRRSEESGFDEHLVKPLDYDVLVRTLAPR